MDPIVSDGRTRLRFWKTMTSRLPPEALIARLKDKTASTVSTTADQPIARLTGKDWVILWQRGRGRNQPVRALFLKLHQAGIGTSIACAPVISPYLAFALIVVAGLAGFNSSLWELSVGAIMLAFVAAYLVLGFLFSRKEGEMLMSFARDALQAHDDR